MGPKLLDTAMWNAGLFTNRLFGPGPTGEEGEEGSQGHSGVVRLWMYQLYEDSIAEDHKKRGLERIKLDKATQAVVDKIEPKVEKTKQVKQTRPKVEQQKSRFPRFAPAFIMDQSISSIDTILKSINDFEPLPVLKIVTDIKEQRQKQEEIKVKKQKKRKHEEELFLMAA